ncbi:MAG TPA: hypothetical protein QGF58_07125 [Myxococcota bacterium]|nr:hypothetical protein [Myxococcota bacterium]
MSAPLPFPHDAKIKGVLEMLFDKKVDFERGETLRAPTVACVLRRDDGTVHGCIVGDAAMTATFGALLSMSPPREDDPRHQGRGHRGPQGHRPKGARRGADWLRRLALRRREPWRRDTVRCGRPAPRSPECFSP